MTEFTPIASTIGGVLIGLSAALVLLFHGRIAGISGIVGGLTHPQTGDVAWRVGFIGGMVLAGSVLAMFVPEGFAVTITRSPAAIVVAGLLVGFGTRLGSGCTSGHGVCGMSRFSPRSFAAAITFMVVGGIMATVVSRVLGGVV